ncbi:MAG: prolipoprotein diacylglyceryl transferase [Candidatus Riflebacteria bacterium]|nr:prolipoprotein diacylglyceryl transferase [Candidatus Riflebacteria bacterium]
MYPIFFSTPWFNVYSYGTMMALGYAFGTAIILWEAHKSHLSVEAVFDMLLIQMISGLVGSRFLYLWEYLGSQTATSSEFIKFESGGLTFFGAVLASIASNLIFIKIKGLPFWQTMDCVGIGLPYGIAIARLGCFFNGCCFGKPCDYPWGMYFPRFTLHKVHPTQLYESICGILIFIILQIFRKKRTHFGQIFTVCLMLYSFFRFNIEFFRGDNPTFFGPLTLSQFLGIIIFCLGIYTLSQLRKNPDLAIGKAH